MSLKNSNQGDQITSLLALLLLIAGGLFALYYLVLDPMPYEVIESATFLDRIAVPFDWVQIGPLAYPINIDNFLIFQEFHSLPMAINPMESYFFFGLVFLIASSFLTMLSGFNKMAIVAGGIGWIVLVTLCNFNGLNIGGASANLPLIIVLVGSLGPVIILHIWGQNLSLILKWCITTTSFGLAIFILVKLSPITQPILFISEYSTVMALGLCIAWIFWNGHSFVSGIYILLARANKDLGMKISYQMGIISIGYLASLFLLFMEMTGDLVTPFFGFSPLYLLIPVGALGWVSFNSKIKQIPNLAADGKTLKILHLLGFGLTLWLCWKLILSGNQPGEELVKHLFLYSQIGFTLFFIVYLFSNFLSIMDSGKAIDEILYKPYSLPYYHLRIGGLMAILVLTIYAEGIISVQLNALTNNIMGDYYYQSGQQLEASILYENSWAKYRKNNKAKHLTAQLLFELNQPTLAKQHLEESFAEYPQVDNIILLSNRLHREDKLFESIFYLEKGLDIFPSNPYLANNLALFYVKIKQEEKAVQTLETHAQNHPTLLSNLSALRTKLGYKGEMNENPTDLIGQINQLALNNASANLSGNELKNAIKSGLEKEQSPMLIHAGWRNLLSDRDRSDPGHELTFLDSLSKQPEMVDYLMDFQETAVIRSLGAGRISEAVKNLNGLAFRNPGSAGYYLNLSSQILAQNLDFKKAARELIVAEEKGFKAFQPHHIAILLLSGYNGNAEEIKNEYQVISPEFLLESAGISKAYFDLIKNLHESLPQRVFSEWKSFPDSELKLDLSVRLLSYKAHGLEVNQIQEVGAYLVDHIENTEELTKFLTDPNWQKEESLTSFTHWLGLGEELTANPYFTPLVLAAAERINDPLTQYELLNDVSQFNHDPLLWIRKIQAARRVNLDNYADDALAKLKEWVSDSELEKLNF